MKHLDDGQLRARLDGELDEASIRHLEECQECQRRFAQIESRAQGLDAQLAFLKPDAIHANGRSSSQALMKFNQRLKDEKEVPLMKKISYAKFRPLWVGLAVVLVIAAAFSFPSVRAWAGEFLGVFRVQQVTVIPIDTTGLSSLSGNSTLGNQISQLLSNSVDMSQNRVNPK